MNVFGWIKRILHRSPALATGSHDALIDAPAPVEEALDGPVWCVAANVLMERGYGPGGAEKRRGTKHFAPGAKVFVYYFFWGTGGERVTVIGRHRKSHRFIRLTMPAKHLANWRAELVYSPYIAKQVREFGEFAGLPADSEKARLRAEEIAASYIKQGAPSQPFVARPPAAE
jgi:hypothetical protein